MRPVLKALGAVVLYLSTSACGGGGGGGGERPKLDEAFCDIQAVSCALPKLRPCCIRQSVCDSACTSTGTDACQTNEDCTLSIGCAKVTCGGVDQDPALVTDPAQCPTITASATDFGDPACFMHATKTPQDACAELCSPSSSGKIRLDPNRWPIDGNLRSHCSATVNTKPIHKGLVDGFLPNGCIDPAPPTFPLASTGTNAVTLTGSGTVTLNGANATTVSIARGYFNIAAPFTTCTSLQATCPTQINQAEIVFADFTFDSHKIQGLRLKLDAQVLTASGLRSGNHFLFTIPPQVIFDAIATLDGNLTGLVVASDQEVEGSIDLDTGELAFQFELQGHFDGKTFEVSGMATSMSVVALAPVVTMGAVTTVEPPGSCTANVTLNASAISAAGLPVTITYFVDSHLVGTGASATTALSIGVKHEVIITGTDSNGMQDTETETVTPTDTLPPTLTCPASQTLECTNGGAVATFAPTVTDNCGVVSGSAACSPPSGTRFSKDASPTTDTCVATDTAGNVASCSFQVTVKDTLPPVVTIANDGSGYSGTQWPPDHGYVSHTLADCIAGKVIDQCDGPLDINKVGKIVRITSNEPENAPGDGSTCADMVITGPSSFQLRSERSGRGQGRVYTVEFTVGDDDKNTAVGSCSFQVPHDQNGTPAIASAPVYCVGANCGGLPGNNASCH